MRPNNSRKIIIIFLLFVILFSSISPVYADSIWKTSDFDLTPLAEKLSGYFMMARNIILAMAAVSIAWACFRIFFGAPDEVEKAKKQIKYSAMALVAFYLLPHCIRIGIDLGQTYAWKPPQ